MFNEVLAVTSHEGRDSVYKNKRQNEEQTTSFCKTIY